MVMVLFHYFVFASHINSYFFAIQVYNQVLILVACAIWIDVGSQPLVNIKVFQKILVHK